VSPFQGGKDHLSHRLVRYGLSRKVAAITLWLLSALYGIFAVLISLQNFDYEFLVLAIALVVWISLFALFLNTKDE
jgi:UDP-GlcNAc:undecaprenyl-phosphate GlcNAc-1-phosphate transferase